MKIMPVDDVHLEFSPDFSLVNRGADVAILAGDICVAHVLHKLSKTQFDPGEMRKVELAQNFYAFIKDVCDNFKHVIYVMGNHEHYQGHIDTTQDILKQYLDFDNLHILENEYVDIDGYRFIGCTLWTDMNKGDPITDYSIRSMMNDFRLIQIKGENYRKFTPRDAFKKHKESLTFIDKASKDHDNVIVVTHMSPSEQSVHPKYKGEYIMNGGYRSSLDEFILDRPQIKGWFFGHQHDASDFMIGDTRVVSNPRGCPGEDNEGFNPELVVEL